jgi:hypothetical protein
VKLGLCWGGGGGINTATVSKLKSHSFICLYGAHAPLCKHLNHPYVPYLVMLWLMLVKAVVHQLMLILFACSQNQLTSHIYQLQAIITLSFQADHHFDLSITRLIIHFNTFYMFNNN